MHQYSNIHVNNAQDVAKNGDCTQDLRAVPRSVSMAPQKMRRPAIAKVADQVWSGVALTWKVTTWEPATTSNFDPNLELRPRYNLGLRARKRRPPGTGRARDENNKQSSMDYFWPPNGNPGCRNEVHKRYMWDTSTSERCLDTYCS